VPARAWILTGADGKPFESDTPGTFGGHRRTKIYGRLDCRAALRAIARRLREAARVLRGRGIGHRGGISTVRRVHAGGIREVEAINGDIPRFLAKGDSPKCHRCATASG
jgi:5,10-methylenetetrahydrofolate reductase